jgi:hypothetical protein
VTRRVTKYDVDAAIFRWLEALAAVPVRSMSAQIAQAAALGCRVTGGRPAALPLVGLVAAEEPLRYCTDRELTVLALRYGSGAVTVQGGWQGEHWVETVRRHLVSYKSIARRFTPHTTPVAVHRCLQRARQKIAAALKGA